MNKDLKQGLMVAGVAVVAYLVYKQYKKPKEVLATAVVPQEPTPINIDLPVREKPIESVVVNGPLFM